MKRFNLSELAVRERAITLFLIVAIILSGLYAFVHLGRAEDPVFTIKEFTVTAIWPGATAREMQNLVADPLEKRMQELRWYDHVETLTRPGIAVMMVKLSDKTPPADVPEQFYQARKKLGDEAHSLPQGVQGPFVNDEYSDVDFALYAVEARGMPPRELTREAETLRQQLLHVPGVKKVNILGERPERIFLDLSNARLATLGISAGDVFAALRRQNTVTPAGSIDTSGAQVFLRLNGAYDDLQQIRDTPIAAGGRVFRLGDIATVKRGYEDPPTYLIRNNGEAALVLAVVMKNGWNGLVLGRALEAERARIATRLPAGVAFSKITDQAVNIRAAVNEFMLKFFVALGVIMLVSLMSLGWRVGVVVAAAVPLTLAVVFVIMMMTGRVFDRITLGALIIALGLLVDDAIIATEMMVVKLEEGFERVKAAAYAWSHTAAPMLAGTLVTVIGFTPVGFARSTAGEYAGNIFWMVGFALIASWVVAVVFTPYLGVKLLPDIEPTPGGREAIYATARYERLRRWIGAAVDHKFAVAAAVVGALLLAGVGMAFVKQQFFPTSDRPELLVDVQMPEGTAIEATQAAALKVEAWIRRQPEAKIVTTYIGRGAPRFFFSYNPELPDPSLAKLVVLTPNANARDRLKLRLRRRIAAGLAPGALVRVSQLVFGPFPRHLVNFRVMGPDPTVLRTLASEVERVMRANPHTRLVNEDWGSLVPTEHFVLDQSRLALLGVSPTEAAQQLQFLLTGVPITQVREGIRTVDVVARSSGPDRLDPAKLNDLTLRNRDGRLIPLSQLGHLQVGWENPVLKRRDRTPAITAWCDYDEALQPPQVSMEIWKALRPIVATLPAGYKIEMGGNIEDSAKANAALAPVFPVMILLTLLALVLQTRSLAATTIVFLTAPLGLVGTVPFLLLLHQPFGFNAILGLIGLSGILMRNTLILIGQIRTNLAEGLNPYDAVIEATVQRARPVILTALAAVLAFIPLTTSVFWGSMAVTLIGGTIGGTVLTLLFLPALYAIWFRIGAAEQEMPVAQAQPAA
jgi:multidrug efflux pump subunit AcrB